MECIAVFKAIIDLRMASNLDAKEAATVVVERHLIECADCREFLGLIRSNELEPVIGGQSHSRSYLIAGSATDPSQWKGAKAVTQQSSVRPDTHRKSYTLFVDGAEYHVENAHMSGAEIMDLAGIPHDIGLILVEEDGSQVQVREEDIVELKPGRRFKKAPRFIRGSS